MPAKQFGSVREVAEHLLVEYRGLKLDEVKAAIENGIAERKARLEKRFMDTPTAGAGAELIGLPVDGLAQYFRNYGGLMSVIPDSNILPMDALRQDMPALESDTLIGQRATTAAGLTPVDVSTQNIRIEGDGTGDKVAVGRVLLSFSPFDFYQYLLRRYERGVARTMEAVIINGDPDTTPATNVNGVGTGLYTRYGKGLRRLAVDANAVTGQNLAGIITLDAFDKEATLLDNSIAPTDLVFLSAHDMYWRLRSYVRTLHFPVSYGPNGAVNSWNFDGCNLVTARDYPNLVDANGRVDTTTPANNTKKSVVCFHKQALFVTEPKDVTYGLDTTDASLIQLSIHFAFGYGFARNKGDFKETVGHIRNINS